MNIHPPGSAEQVADFQSAQNISGMVFNPVTRSYVPQAEVDAYMAIQRVHEANMKKQAEEDYSYAASESLRREHEKNMEKQREEDCDSKSQAQPEPLTTRNLQYDLTHAIERTFSFRKFLNGLHPDVKKIINFGELLNERV